MIGRPVRAGFAAIAALVVLASSLGVVVASGPNQLSNGRVSPTSGTTSTVFTFSVDYRSDKEFAATSVVAVVAGRSVTLRLASGNASAGTFRGTSTLPAGRWPVRFEAQASQGPSPSLAGQTLVVRVPALTQPRATPKPTPAPPPPSPPPPAKPVPATTAPAPRASTPAAIPQPEPSAAATKPATRSPTDAAAAPSTSSAASMSEAPSASSGVIGETVRPGRDDDNPTGMQLGLGALSVAALASAALVVAHRRRTPGEASEVAAEPIPLMTVVRPNSPAGSQQVEDPILAAMGLGTTSQPDPDAPITRSVHFGPGERPAPSRPRAH